MLPERQRCESISEVKHHVSRPNTCKSTILTELPSENISFIEITWFYLNGKRNTSELLGGVTFAVQVESGDFKINQTYELT